ncbi:MAG TPA: hypothetical protein PKH71_04910, partial [Methanoregulaceae archaeon]|nr:hypothetical protein [Methanoregulaceae archaeon]
DDRRSLEVGGRQRLMLEIERPPPEQAGAILEIAVDRPRENHRNIPWGWPDTLHMNLECAISLLVKI